MSKPANRHTSETEAATQGLTRRRALQAGAVAGTGIALAALGSSPAMAGTGRQSSTAPGSSPDWTAQWIGRNDPATRPALGQQAPAPLLRKGFTLQGGIAQVRLRIAGLGYYVAWINGYRVGSQVLNPGPVQYAIIAVYDSFDVTRLLQPGQNAIGVMLGRSYFSATTSEGFGWGARPDWHEPRLLAQLDIAYHDGSTARVVSDASWQLADGPLTDDLYFGENYDARQVQPGWTAPGFAAAGWSPAPVQASPTQQLAAATMPPVEVTGTLESAFTATFFNPAANTYQNSVPAGYRQTSNLVPLYYGLVPTAHEPAVYGNLIADIHSHGNHLNTGAIGTKMLLPVLTAHGDIDLAYTIATQTTYPSWGYWVSQGATTSWETWSHTGPQQSLDHAFLGTINDWLYHDLAGISAAAAGFAKVLARPAPPAGLDYAAASVDTVRGLVASSWRRTGHELELTVEIPGNTTAQVDVPVSDGGSVQVSDTGGVSHRHTDGGYASYTAGSGQHRFVSVP